MQRSSVDPNDARKIRHAKRKKTFEKNFPFEAPTIYEDVPLSSEMDLDKTIQTINEKYKNLSANKKCSQKVSTTIYKDAPLLPPTNVPTISGSAASLNEGTPLPLSPNGIASLNEEVVPQLPPRMPPRKDLNKTIQMINEKYENLSAIASLNEEVAPPLPPRIPPRKDLDKTIRMINEKYENLSANEGCSQQDLNGLISEFDDLIRSNLNNKKIIDIFPRINPSFIDKAYEINQCIYFHFSYLEIIRLITNCPLLESVKEEFLRRSQAHFSGVDFISFLVDLEKGKQEEQLKSYLNDNPLICQGILEYTQHFFKKNLEEDCLDLFKNILVPSLNQYLNKKDVKTLSYLEKEVKNYLVKFNEKNNYSGIESAQSLPCEAAVSGNNMQKIGQSSPKEEKEDVILPCRVPNETSNTANFFSRKFSSLFKRTPSQRTNSTSSTDFLSRQILSQLKRTSSQRTNSTSSTESNRSSIAYQLKKKFKRASVDSEQMEALGKRMATYSIDESSNDELSNEPSKKSSPIASLQRHFFSNKTGNKENVITTSFKSNVM